MGFLFVAAAALRLARFNIQAGSVDKRYFVGMPSPAAAAVPAATVFAYPYGFASYDAGNPARADAWCIAMVLVPALLMVSTIRFRSFKTFDLQTRRSYTVLLLVAIALALIVAQPESLFVVSPTVICCLRSSELAWSRLRPRAGAGPRRTAPKTSRPKDTKITKG